MQDRYSPEVKTLYGNITCKSGDMSTSCQNDIFLCIKRRPVHQRFGVCDAIPFSNSVGRARSIPSRTVPVRIPHATGAIRTFDGNGGVLGEFMT